MSESTFRKRLKKEPVAEFLGKYKCTFTLQMGLELLDYALNLDAMFFGIAAKNITRLALDFAGKSYTNTLV